MTTPPDSTPVPQSNSGKFGDWEDDDAGCWEDDIYPTESQP